MKFWRINHPDYRSDYDNYLINGSLDHPFGLPGVHCPMCGETWGGGRILPFPCPDSLRKRKELRRRWPIPLAAHKSLQALVRTELLKAGHSLSELRPGDDFQPAYLDIPAQPIFDFLWGHIGSVVISRRIKEMLEEEQVIGATFCEVVPRKIGRRKVKLPAPVPDSGEPEGLMREAPLLKDVTRGGPYYEMIVLNESGDPPGGTPKRICSGCGRPDVDSQTRRLLMRPEMWQGEDIFFLATTLWIIVTDRVKEMLERSGATNISFMSV
jgi:hypothetical protein